MTAGRGALMKTISYIRRCTRTISVPLIVLLAMIMALPRVATALTPPEPVVAVHVSEQTEYLETMPGVRLSSP
jgi:hypothetical protein